MKSYHNTTGHKGEELTKREWKASSLEYRILQWMKDNSGRKFTPWEVWELFGEKKYLITSIRRALSNLVKFGDLADTRFTDDGKIERYGDWNYFWYYPV